MSALVNWNGKLNVPAALLRAHDSARAELVRATMEGGRIAEAATRVAQLCLPHFEHEERSIFPVLALLPHLERGDVEPDMMDILPLISDFSARHHALNDHHQTILTAIEELLQAAHKEKNREFAEFAYNMRVHETVEDEVIYPAVILVGKYLREKRPS
jgi:hemerythrin superfamily protein